MKKTMKQLPPELQPRERALRDGVEVLSNAELLAVLLRTGNGQETAAELAGNILVGEGSLQGIREAGRSGLCRYPGMGAVKALTLLCALELGRRALEESRPRPSRISSPHDAAQIVMEDMKRLRKENFRLVILDTKNQVLGVETVSVGSLNSSIVHPRELFYHAIRHSAAGIILVHNHPSGDPTPSEEDISVTRRLTEAGTIMGIQVLDHLVIGNPGYFSFREEGLI